MFFYLFTDGEVDGFSQLSNLGPHYSNADKYNVRKESLVVLTDINNVYNSTCSNTNAAYRLDSSWPN